MQSLITRLIIYYPKNFAKKIIDLVLQQDDEKQKNIQLINRLKERIRQNQNEIDNIIRAIKAGIFSQSTKNELEKLESEAELLKDQLLEAETMQSPEYTKEAISAWLSKIAAKTKKSENENKYLLYSFVSAVYAYEDGTVKVVYNLGDSEQKITLSDMNGAGDRT